MTPPLKSPYPYFGGKGRVAADIWSRIGGDVPNYVEPFCGSLAVLLARPDSPGVETVNDLDGWVVNFWRAIKADPESVAEHADWPVSELDLHARGNWLFHRRGVGHWVELLRDDPDFYDAKSAGWWVWGISNWIGSGWGPRQLPHLSGAQGINRQLPHLSGAQGINRKLPHLSEGKGINRKLPHLSEGKGINRKLALIAYFAELADRTRETRMACGAWDRVLGRCVTTDIGITGVVLDPPYGEGNVDYAAGGNRCGTVAGDVRDWAVENGDNPKFRIALCGYDGAFDIPSTWEVHEWKAQGGYGSQGEGEGRANAKRERIWFSPHCVGESKGQLRMFGVGGAA